MVIVGLSAHAKIENMKIWKFGNHNGQHAQWRTLIVHTVAIKDH